MLRLTGLPIEILEQILLCLPGQDIVKMEAVSRQFQDLARGLPKLQYRRELFVAGLMDNPHYPCDMAEGRRLCEEYAYKWSDAVNLAGSICEVSLGYEARRWDSAAFWKNLLVTRCYHSGNIHFTHIPPAMSQKPIERWNIPPFRFATLPRAAYLPKNVFVVTEEKEASIHIHLLNLLDGFPYRVSPSNVITWALPQEFEGVEIEKMAMTASRLMMHVRSPPGSYRNIREWRMVVWDWETGDLVFNRSSTDESKPIRSHSWVDFLDEFRIIMTSTGDRPDGPELLVSDTLVPQDHPRNLRRFGLPPQKQSKRQVCIYLDHDRSLGTVNRDGPLITDPTQAIFVICLLTDPVVLLVLWIQHLIEPTCSMRTDVQIPWDEWGRGSVAMEIPEDGMDSVHLVTVHGTRVLVMCGCRYIDQGLNIHIFDFSRRGSASLSLSDESDGGTERRALFKDGRSCKFELGDPDTYWPPQSLGDSVVTYVMPPYDDSFNTLRILDLM